MLKLELQIGLMKLILILMPSVTGNLIFTISNEGYLYVLEKNNGNIIRITNLYENYKEKKRPKIKPIGLHYW